MDEFINIEVVYVMLVKQLLIELIVLKGLMVEQGILVLGIMDIYFEIDLKIVKVGVWNCVCKLLVELQDGDCIEVY